MSVTFAVATSNDAIRVFRLTCEVFGVLGDWTGIENAYSEAKAHALVCTDSLCASYGADVDEVSDLPAEINMANANATRVLEALGYLTDDQDLSGTDDAESFLGRVLIALAVAPVDEGVPARELVTAEQLIGGGRQIDCGRPAGYLQTHLEHLHELAQEALAAGQAVTWA